MPNEVIKCGDPNQFSQADVASFIDLVHEAGEVSANTLRQNVPKAEKLAFLWLDGALIAVGALKYPLKTYRAKFHGKSGVEVTEQEYPCELGYIVVVEAARGQGNSKKIVQSLLAATQFGLFATSHTTNAAMHKTLLDAGFQKQGRTWDGKDAGEKIQLFLRPGGA